MQTIKGIINSDSELSLDSFIKKLLSIPEVESTVWQSYIYQINYEMDTLCGTKVRSVLREKIEEITPKSLMEDIANEMNMRCPKVLDVLVSLCTPMHMQLQPTNLAVPSMYSIAQNSRNNQMNSFQKEVTAACIRFGAGNGLFELLSRMGMCLPERSKLPFLNSISSLNGLGVIEALKNGRTIKVTVDNIDGRIRANQVRVGSGNRDYHYTHWSVLVDRVMPIDLPELSRKPKTVPVNGPDPKHFYLSSDEHTALRLAYTWLVEKVLVEELTPLNIFKVPDVLQHLYGDITDRPSLVYPMFVIMKDPKYLPNCVQIMDTIQNSLKFFYSEAARDEEFENTATIPLGGDQLTRTTFESARHLRGGTHNRSDRLEQFTPVIEELFHIEQDLLEKIVKRFYSTKSSRDVGTLSNYRAVLHRTNVNGLVKSSTGFESHKDFIHTVARAMLVELALETLGLDDKTSAVQLPENIKMWKYTKKLEWLDGFVKPVVDVILRNFSEPDMTDVNMFVAYQGQVYNVTAPAHYRGKTFEVDINGKTVKIAVPAERCSDIPVSDDVYNYSLGFLRAAMDLIIFHHVIKAGDVKLLTVMLKRFIPLFIALTSYRSKYAIECINFITKTECILSEYDSVRVKLGAFVNTKGKPGKNKASDMQQENHIKQVKNVIRNLGAGKTDKAMERSSKAAPVICNIVSDIQETLGIGKRHKRFKKSSDEDLSLLSVKMRQLRPFHIHNNRNLQSFAGISSNVLTTLDKFKLREFIMRHSMRTVCRVNYDSEEDDED